VPQLGDRQPYEGPETPLLLIGRDPGPTGDFGREAHGGRLPRNPNDPSAWLPGQGRANACGTTTLAYVLRYLLGPSAPAREQIDARVRRADIFTAPHLLYEYARQLGMAVRAFNDADLDLVLGVVAQGIPVVVLTDTTPLDLEDTANLHWVALVGHNGDSLAIYNPHGFQEAIDRASFDSHWREARIFGLPAWRRFALAVAPAGTELPATARAGMSAFGADWASNGVAGIVNASTSLRRELAGHGVVKKGLFGALGALGLVAPALQAAVGSAALLAGALPRDASRIRRVMRAASATLRPPPRA